MKDNVFSSKYTNIIRIVICKNRRHYRVNNVCIMLCCNQSVLCLQPPSEGELSVTSGILGRVHSKGKNENFSAVSYIFTYLSVLINTLKVSGRTKNKLFCPVYCLSEILWLEFVIRKTRRVYLESVGLIILDLSRLCKFLSGKKRAREMTFF